MDIQLQFYTDNNIIALDLIDIAQFICQIKKITLFYLQFSPSLYSPNWLNFSDGYHGLSSTHPHRHLSNIHPNVKSHTRLLEFINWDKSHARNCPYTHRPLTNIHPTASDAKVLISHHTRLFIACHGLSLTHSHDTQHCFGASS